MSIIQSCCLLVFAGLMLFSPYDAFSQEKLVLPTLDQTQANIFLYKLDDLLAAKSKYQQKQEPFLNLVNGLRAKADKWLEAGPFSVMQKVKVPPSNDMHDYYSLGPYWWPNPDTEDGLPYVRHDGKVNPETNKYDRVALSKMSKAVFALALAYFYTDYEPYAKKANDLLYTWFIDPATKMNPHLEFGQAIPGITEGRGIGIIETGSLIRLVNVIGLLKNAESFSPSNYQHLQEWVHRYNHWLLTSDKGWDERRWHNNHGSSFDSQVAGFSLFTSQDSIAKMILDSVIIKRINRQIQPDGSQPWELERTKSMSYSIKNLNHLMENAILAEHCGLNLWNYESKDGRSIKQAIRFLIPYMLKEKEWPYTQYKGIESQMNRFKDLIWMANQYIDDPLIRKAYTILCTEENQSMEINLLYPDLKAGKYTQDAKPFVILKLDDLWCEEELVHPGWIRVVDFLNAQQVTGTIGLVGNSLEKDNEAYFDWIRARDKEGYEIWHHGFCHCRHKENDIEIREYRGKSYVEQFESLLKTQQLAKEKLGITLHTFGAPYNSTDRHTVEALAKIPDVKVWMYKETSFPTDQFLLRRIAEVNIEYPVHQPDFEKFKEGYDQYKNEPILIIQGHPRSWVEDKNRFEVFKKIILFLKDEGVTFITPYQYYLQSL